ncbi:type 4b pilus Flp biogenesis protein TadC [Pseudomonas paraeruginosa]|uniref:type 4b pilus Flp biogenesis protein TadC n=1 Tax=Pseudomonas aeruginosa group TaxID=136841 RepID=UPI00071B6593|nr:MULTISPECIES: type 4b pilus Flp biogenesis protein TadC [Pseudomonas aeruginosa group]KSF78333.1 TadC [Pseudomonas aeruginosa]PTC34995.1 Type II/IV secretion system protein TadC [Pseudomonas aeruginosa]
MQAQWLIFAAVLMALGGGLLLLLQARNGSREQRLIEKRLGGLANPGGAGDWLAGMTERMDDSFWVRRLQLMDSEARQLLQQAGWHASRHRTLYLISVFLTPLLFVLLVLLARLLRAESEASHAVPLLFAAGIGFLLPKQVLKHFAKARRALIAEEMILFVQLIRILFDAGLTVEQALRVVCQEGRGITPQLARELELALARAGNGIDLAEELEALARRLQVDPLNDCCGVLRQMLRQGGSARGTLLTLKQLFEDRRLTTLQERIGKLSAKMSLVMMVLLFPALLIVLAGPGVIAISKALGGLG